MEEAMNSDFIKKSKIHYLKCTEGDLHQGQVLNFVCVDSKCSKKGLICPVCRMGDHKEHSIIPLKIFLGEMKNRFSGKSNESEMNSLSDYLRTLDNTKKELLCIVKETVSQIAEKVRRLETTIVDNYNHLRKMILTQSTVVTKLPGLIELMLGPGDKDPKQLHKEFQKYADLIQYEGDKVSFFDSSKKMVEDYSNLPGTVTAHLSTLVPELTKIFDSLPLQFSSSKQTKAPSLSFTFSPTNKRDYITLSNPKSASISSSDMSEQKAGCVFVNEGLGLQHQSVTFKIVDNISGYLSVGMGLTDLIKKKGYKLDADDTNHGAYVISTLGANFHHKQFEKQEIPSFVYGAGDVIIVQWNKKDKKLLFSRRNGVEKFVMDINQPDTELAKLQFMVALFQEGDKIEIVD